MWWKYEKTDTFRHLNKESKLKLEMDIEEVVAQIVAMNYGAYRLLSAMVHELRVRQAASHAYSVKLAEENGWPSIQRDNTSPLADGIENLLEAGLLY